MNYSFTDATANGVATTFSFSFVGDGKGYLRDSDVHVFVNGVEVSYTLTGENQVTLSPAPANGALVRIRRIMPKDTIYAQFNRGITFNKVHLNNSFLQSLYVVHEFLDGFLDEFPYVLKGGMEVLGSVTCDGLITSADIDMLNNKIKNLAYATEASDAVPLVQAIEIASQAQGANFVSETKPLLAFSGMRWYKPSDASTYVWYVDVDGGQWVEESVQSAEGVLGQSVAIVGHIKQLPNQDLINGKVFLLDSFYPNIGLGGGKFKWDSSKPKTAHTGGTILDPDRIAAWDGTFANIATLYTAGVSGVGCFVKIDENLTVDTFGAVPDGEGLLDPVLVQMESVGIREIVANNRTYETDNFIPASDALSFAGNAFIKIKTGHIFNVSVCENPSGKLSHSIMFTDVDWDWGTVAYLKSIGYDTMFSYGLFNQTNQLLLLNSCVAAKSKMLAYSNLSVASLPQLIDEYKEVIGYYIYDEPDALGVPIATQDARINSYRAVTNKPLWCSLAIDSELTQLVSDGFDYALIQLYYGETATRTKYGGGSLSRSNTLRSLELVGSFKYKMPKTKIVPIVGLFTNAGYSFNTQSLSRFSQFAVRTSEDGTFATFIWGGNTDPNNVNSVKDDEVLLLGAQLVAKAAINSPKIIVTPVVFASDNEFNFASLQGIQYIKSRITPRTQDVFPVSITNVGSPVDDYNQGFHDQGIAAVGTGGYAVIDLSNDKCCGVNYARFTFKNYVDVQQALVGLSVTQDGGHTFTDITGDIANNLDNFRYYVSPANTGLPLKYNIALKLMPLVNAATQPWKMISGWLYCSNWPDTTY